MILNPLTQVLMYAFVLSSVLSSKLPGIENKYAYAIYLTAGILGWNLFSEIVNRLLTVFLDNANLLKKIAFPKITLPVIVIGSTVFNALLLFGSILVIFGLLGHFPGMRGVFLSFPLMIVTIFFASSIGLFCGILNVFMRDIGQVIPIILQFWFWFTPICYPTSIIPKRFQFYIKLNPMYHIIEGFHQTLVLGQTPEYKGLALVFLFSILGLGISLFLFRKANSDMADVL